MNATSNHRVHPTIFSYLALYRGLLPKMMRLGPGGAIMLIVYEYVYELLKTSM